MTGDEDGATSGDDDAEERDDLELADLDPNAEEQARRVERQLRRIRREMRG